MLLKYLNMTIGKLKEIIKDLSDDMLVGRGGHFGEYLECFGAYTGEVYKSLKDDSRIKILKIEIEDPGLEPD
jgi:hypothetical protein